MTENSPAIRPSLTFRSGGWVIALAGVLVLLILAWAFAGILMGHRPKGDGQSVDTYGFDLSNLRTNGGAFVASGNPRDFFQSLDQPQVLPGHEMLAYNAKLRSKYVVTTDRVIGVEINGKSRAYPLDVMNVHEVVNDELAGVPIAVTFSPLCDSAIVFDRRVNGKPLQFGVSGLLLDSNLVMYDKQADVVAHTSLDSQDKKPATQVSMNADQSSPVSAAPASSLWSQMAGMAIAGPAGDATLAQIPNVNVCTWKHWLATHPTTEVILPDAQDEKRMKKISYSRYLLSSRLEFPIGRKAATNILTNTSLDNMPGTMPDKMPVIAITAGGETRVITLREAADRGADAPWNFVVGGVPIVVVSQKDPASVLVGSSDATPIQVTPCLWFVWQAFHAPAAPDQVLMPSHSVK
ncbi:hypothetical protein LBMAG50_12320 [Phycisphaerae bacterium]|nr:hypothetical protein LBMAG50_12320 [Phycisphaerae bacterium]